MLRALSLLSVVARYAGRGPVRKTAKRAAFYSASIFAAFLGIIFLFVAMFIAIGTRWGFDLASLAVALPFLCLAIYALFRRAQEKSKAAEAELAQDEHADVLLRQVPDNIRESRTFQDALRLIEDHPFGSVTAATFLGALISSGMLDEELL